MADIESKFTPAEVAVMEKMWDTPTVAPVGRRRALSGGSYELYKFERPTRPVDFPAEGAEDEEFALKGHEKNIEMPLSPYYVNLRNLPGDLLTLVAESIAEVTKGTEATVCTGIPAAGDPIAQRYSEVTGIPRIDIFGKAESSSGRKIVAGSFAPRGIGRWHNLLILDDLITEADTKFEAAEVAQKLGYNIVGIAVLVDRQQGGKEQLETQGFKVYAPLPITKIFEYYYTTGKIDGNRYRNSMNYLNNARAVNDLPQLELLTA